MNAGFDEIPYQGAPFVWGSLQDTSPMTFVYQGAPFLVVSKSPDTKYLMDTRGRLTQATFPNGTVVAYNYDSAGNRSTVVTTPGTFGL